MQKILLLIVFLTMSYTMFGQDYKINGNEITVISTSTKGSIKTNFTIKDDNTIYPIYISKNGCAYILKTSRKTGKEYKKYLSKELSKEICQQLGIEYKNNK